MKERYNKAVQGSILAERLWGAFILSGTAVMATYGGYSLLNYDTPNIDPAFATIGLGLITLCGLALGIRCMQMAKKDYHGHKNPYDDAITPNEPG